MTIARAAYLGEDEERDPEADWTLAIVRRRRGAHRVVHAAAVDGVDQERHRADAADEAEDRQSQVPERERAGRDNGREVRESQ